MAPAKPPSKNIAHLPLDALPHSLLFLLGPDRLASLPITCHHFLGETYSATAPWHSYPQLKRLCRALLMKEWEERSPDSDRYPYYPLLRPHPFKGLNKFDAGRLHQTRSGKSYLRAHRAWDDDRPTTCPRGNEAPQTRELALLSCPASEPTRTRHFQGVSDLGPDAPVWFSASLLAALARFMRSTQTTFPPGMFSRPTLAVSLVSSRSSAVVSFGYFISSQEAL